MWFPHLDLLSKSGCLEVLISFHHENINSTVLLGKMIASKHTQDCEGLKFYKSLHDFYLCIKTNFCVVKLSALGLVYNISC